ncbi:MAG: CRTAC1 family protein, partial [Thermoguttaceae bacterium]|nr:CRTAC1 family protein [Thermoguttaceae bacterium]
GSGNVGAGACFLDSDNDGDLDLYVANYLKFDYRTHPQRTAAGHPVYPSPMDFLPEPDILYRNDGQGAFTDITRQAGIVDERGTGMGIVAADYDNDGDTDLFVLNDVAGNYLFRNDGTGHFEEAGLRAGFSYNLDGRALGSMGIDCADYDNDGWLDFFQTSYQKEPPVLFRNLGHGVLEDVTVRAGAHAGSVNNVKWGCGFVDFDNDGYRDLYVALGHLQDNIERFDSSSSYEARSVLLWNRGDGKFLDVSDRSGDGLRLKRSARGAAFDDLDNDGRVDVVVLNSRREPTVLSNQSPGDSHWLQVELQGVRCNRDAVGAKVKVVAGDLTLFDEKHSGRGYQSHFGSRLHFGLGPRRRVDRIEVRWPGGGEDVVENVEADQRLVVRQGATRP